MVGGLLAIAGIVLTILLIFRAFAGSWADVFKGILWVLGLFLLGAVAIAALFGIIAFWAWIGMAIG